MSLFFHYCATHKVVRVRPTHLQIDLSALAHNLTQVKTLVSQAKILAMVKANAYGHGAVACLPALQQADALGVACVSEAMELINAGWQKPIVLIEGVFSQAEWQQIQPFSIECVIHNHAQLAWFLQQPNDKAIWLKLNTGMNRLGFGAQEIESIAKQLQANGNQIILTSHFANADDKNHVMNDKQWQLFIQVLTELKTQISPTIQGSLCNSAGIVNWADRQLDWVRPGIMLYGATPVTHATAQALNLRPVMQFNAQIFAIHDLTMGETVGYGSRWIAPKPSRIGIVSVGYGDGYPRVITKKAYITSQSGQHLPIIGRVAMDMLMVDITDFPTVCLGEPVQLWGNSPTIDEVASWNDSISYELLCIVTHRPSRSYTATTLL